MFSSRKRWATGQKRGTSKRRYASGMRRGAAAAPKARLSRSMTWSNNHHFRRNCSFDFIYMQPEGGAAPAYTNGYVFRLDQLPNYGEFTSLFDMYRFNSVVMRFIPTATQLQTNTDQNNSEAPLLYCVIDYNNADAPASADELKEYGNCRVLPMTRPLSLKFRPRTATPVYRDAVSAAYLQNAPKLWLDCNYADIPHYGVRVYVPGGTTNNVYRMRIECTFYVSFRNTK